jgi:hypothetical protein
VDTQVFLLAADRFVAMDLLHAAKKVDVLHSVVRAADAAAAAILYSVNQRNLKFLLA